MRMKKRTQRQRQRNDLCILALISGLSGCGRSPIAPVTPATQPAAFTPEGRWRSQKHTGMILRAHLLPDGTLNMVDARGQAHPFHHAGPDRWEARISRVARGTITREGDQLVFRTEPTSEAKKPMAEKNGLVIMQKSKPIEDRMTRVGEGETPHPTSMTH
jgi:hypothetical protein